MLGIQLPHQLGVPSRCAHLGGVLLLGMWNAAAVALALFHTQHAFNPSYVRAGKDWRFRDAALKGSSFLNVVPWWLRWVTFGIEYHSCDHKAQTGDTGSEFDLY